MTNKQRNARLSELLDREDILDIVGRYSRAVDRRDRELLASLYWPDGTDIHGSFDGTAPDFVEYAMWSVGRFKRTHHLMGHTTLEFEGNRALGETYFVSYHLRTREGTEELYDEAFGGRYLDVFEKRGEEWRIFRRTMLIDWGRIYPDTIDWEATVFSSKSGAKLRLGARRPNDLLYEQYDLLRAFSTGKD